MKKGIKIEVGLNKPTILFQLSFSELSYCAEIIDYYQYFIEDIKHLYYWGLLNKKEAEVLFNKVKNKIMNHLKDYNK